MSKSSVVKIPKASELVAANLRRRIITGELQAGQLLPSEVVLMKQFGVSRPTLREAFRILECEAIITVVRGARGGGRVLRPDGAVAGRYIGILLQYQSVPLSDVYRARAEIEVSAVGMIGSSGRKSAVQKLEHILDEAGDVIALNNDEAFAKYSVRFHLAVVESAGCTTLAELGRMLFQILDEHNTIFVAAHPDGIEREVKPTAVRAYTELVRLLNDADIDAAQRHWRNHLLAIEQYMVGDQDATLVAVLS